MATILVTDDSVLSRKHAKNVVEAFGHQTVEASSGEQALEVLRSQTIDLALIDLIMPEMTGFEVLEAIQDQKIQVPVVVITADIQNSTQTRCKELGALAILNKPLKPAAIQPFLEKTLPSA